MADMARELEIRKDTIEQMAEDAKDYARQANELKEAQARIKIADQAHLQDQKKIAELEAKLQGKDQMITFMRDQLLHAQGRPAQAQGGAAQGGAPGVPPTTI